jgi:hypothetical protein
VSVNNIEEANKKVEMALGFSRPDSPGLFKN